MRLSARILKFGIAGVIGFAVDLGALYALVLAGMDPRLARCFSIAAALVSTWLVNRSLAFADRTGPPSLGEFARYVGASMAALLVNMGVYQLLLGFGGIFTRWLVVPLVIATGISMCVNFLSYFKVVFARRD